MKECTLAIDLGGTHFRIGIVLEDYSLHHFTIYKSEVLNGDVVRNFISIIKEYLSPFLKQFKLSSIVIGVPSTISKDKKIVYSTPNIKGFNNINLKDPLEESFSVPVFLENDVNLLLQYEIIKNSLQFKGITLGFYIGTGYGNAIYIDDHFLQGKNGVAGELGHIPVLHKNDICTCGNEGCIEIYASGKFLKVLQEKIFPETLIDKLFTKHKAHPKLIDFVERIAIPIATEINIFDPDQIVIGGGVIQMKDFPIELLEEKILKYTRKPFPAEGLKILYAEKNQTIGLLGAAYYARLQLEKLEKRERVL